MPTTLSVVKAGRIEQITLSQAASRRLVDAYRGVWSDINGQLARLQQQIADARKLGGDDAVRVSWLYQQQRLQQMQQQVAEAVQRFTGGAQQLTVDLMRTSAQNGADVAVNALQAMIDDLNLPPELNISFNRINFAALDDAANNAFTLATHAQSGAPRRTVAGLYKSMPPDMAKRAKQAIISAVATGQAPSVTARALRDQMGIGLSRALTIARTEQMGAYRRASTATFRANADVCDGWEWLAAPDACEFCQSQNGTKHSLNEEMDTHPRCRCVEKPLARPLSDILAAFASGGGSGEE